jgi:hypothetical protein
VRQDSSALAVVIACDTGARYLSDPHRWNGSL